MLTQTRSSNLSSSEQSIFLIDQASISLEQVLCGLRAAGQLQPMLETFVSRYILAQIFDQRPDLAASPAELEQAVQQLKQQFTEAEFRLWLLDQAWDEAILSEQIAFDLKLAKLKTEIAAPKLLDSFIEQKLRLDQVVLSRIVVDRLDLAEELRLMILEQEASFEQLARDYSITPDAICHGMMGYLSRAEVQSMLGFDPYQIAPQMLLKPIFCQNQWWLVRVEAIQPASLDESITQQLQAQIFNQWLMQQIQSLEITLRLEAPQGSKN